MKIDFIGVIYFLHQGHERLVLLPNGTKDTHGVEPHFANFFLRKEDVSKYHWPDMQTIRTTIDGPVKEEVECLAFPILKPSDLTISPVSDVNRKGVLNTDAHETFLPQVKSVNPDFRVNPKNVDAIARLPIRHGRITAFRIIDAAMSQLVLDNKEPIMIRAVSEDGTKWIQLNSEAEIVFSNTSDALKKDPQSVAPPDDSDDDPLVDPDNQPLVPVTQNHFILFAKLDEHRAFDKLTKSSKFSELPDIESNHPYIRILESLDEVPRGDCSNQCC